MFRYTMLVGFLLCTPLAVAQDVAANKEAIDKIVEGTRKLEAQYRCLGGDVLACLVSAGLKCELTGDAIASSICSGANRPLYKVYQQDSEKWVVEILWQRPKNYRHQY